MLFVLFSMPSTLKFWVIIKPKLRDREKDRLENIIKDKDSKNIV